jgi:ubiquitin C-terminal hydrolase
MITTVKLTTTMEHHLYSNGLRDAVLECLKGLEEASTRVPMGHDSASEYVKVIAKGQSVYVISHSLKMQDSYVKCASFEEASTTFVKRVRDAVAFANK